MRQVELQLANFNASAPASTVFQLVILQLQMVLVLMSLIALLKSRIHWFSKKSIGNNDSK